jgi:hypothetical protein
MQFLPYSGGGLAHPGIPLPFPRRTPPVKTRFHKLIFFALMGLSLLGCGRQAGAGFPTPQVAETPTVTSTTIPTVTNSSVPLNLRGLPDTVQIEGNRIIFTEWGFSVELPANEWQYDPSYYRDDPDFEGFMLFRRPGFTNDAGEEYHPGLGILFYTIPEGTELVNFSVELRIRSNENFPSIEDMFGYAGSEPILNIPALGYYGHLDEEKQYSVYVIHAVNDTVGVQVALEIVDSVLTQARPEFYQIMESLAFERRMSTASGMLQTPSPPQETWQSMRSASFVSEAAMHGGLDFSRGGDGNGRGVDPEGRITNCADLAANLANYQPFEEIIVTDPNNIDPSILHRGDMIIFTDSTIADITAHASIIFRLDQDMIYIIGIFGPHIDRSYEESYEDVPITEFFPTIFQALHIYRYSGGD